MRETVANDPVGGAEEGAFPVEAGGRASYAHVRSLERGLLILQALNRLCEASVVEVAQHAGLPRATVHRLLETLADLGYVARTEVRGRFRPAALVRTLSDGYRVEDWISVVAEPLLNALQVRLSWPVSIATYGERSMLLRVNTHRGNPLSLVKGVPGTRLSLLGSSMGRAYLAACRAGERDWLLQSLRAEGVPVSAPDLRRVQEAQERGFSTRRASGAERTSSLAAAVPTTPKVFACINVEWIDSVLTLERAVELFADDLKATARQIAERYSR